MSKEYFWGDELSGSKKEIKWNPSFEDDDDDDDIDIEGIQHFLFLKQAVLGVNAKEGERNVVEISTENFEGDDVKQPLFSLKLGLNESSILDIAVQPPVTLSLVSGNGPVYLNGQHMIEINAEDDDEEDELEEEEEEFVPKAIPVNAVTKSKKRPLSTSESVAKKMKMSKEDQNDDEDEEEEDEEMPVVEELDDDDDDEDDEDFEGEEEEEDEEDSDDDEEDEDEDEEEEEEEDEEEDEEAQAPAKPVKKVKGMKGKMNGTATAKGDSKLKTKEATNTVTKSKGKKKILGLDEIKKKLQESSGLPKKEERFKNYVRSTFHMSDLKKLNEVWGWYRASLQK